MFKKLSLLILPLVTFALVKEIQSANDGKKSSLQSVRALEKFEPKDGQCILFAGQELEAIGGLEKYNDGYFNHFQKPGGFTMYTNFRPGDISFGHRYKGLDGLSTSDDWGDGFSNMQMQINDPDFDNSVLAIGLELVNHEDSVTMGVHDDMILELGQWLKSLGKRPVFLRIGYEFDAPDWNFYEKEPYKLAFRRIRTKLDSMGVNNVAYVWQSKGWGSSYKELEEWYPGEEYVDWCAYSFFSRYKEGQPMIDFARNKSKPLFLAEASPMIEENGVSLKIDLSDMESQKQAYEEWFKPLFKTIHANPDVVKAVSYINCNWKAHRMWQGNTPFKDIDARLQRGEFISSKWREETSKAMYLKASPTLFKMLTSK